MASSISDLNLIEHLWDYLGREVSALNPPPRSLHELKQGLLCVWSSLPIPVSDNLINSMGNRCRQSLQHHRKKSSGVKSQDLGANSQVQNVKLGGHQTCLSINRLWHELCDMLRRLVGTTAPGHHDCSIQE
ncbi:DDE_3 domain-containing protein [Trichonephila clavipes]|nr:DDE_3 domain-containing protein [Trichonephila clavipes]